MALFAFLVCLCFSLMIFLSTFGFCPSCATSSPTSIDIWRFILYNCDQVTRKIRKLVMQLTRFRKQERREALKTALSQNPFLTDEELAQRFGVSVSTIRLDRGKLDIPEMRLRTLAVAHESYSALKALGEQEIIGRLLELRIGEYARSELLIEESMVLAKARVARGHHLFAQVNSLAIAVVDAEVAVTASTRLKFVRPVRLEERVLAEGHVIKRKDNKYWVEVVARVGEEQVLKGRLVVFAFPEPLEGSARRE